MAEVKSTKHPNLWVHDLGVRFRDGVAEVSDRKVLEALAKVDGVEVPKVAPQKRQAAQED